MLTTKEKGDIGLTKVIAELTEQGFGVSLPISEHLRYDCIIEKNGNCCRVQSKYTTSKEDKIEVKIESSWANSEGTHSVKRKKGDYDILAVYCPNTKRCYFLADNDFDNQCSINLRLKESKYPKKTFRWAKDYENCDDAFYKVIGELAESGIAPDC